MAEALLKIDSLSKTYAAPVLQDISFELHQGESLALVGANGAGKSTFIKILLGLVRPSSGGGQLFGKPLGSPEALARIGYLPEMPSFWPELSARELLGAMGGIRGLSRESITARGSSLLAALGLALRGDRPMAGYSKGMLQRAGIAQALLHNPDLIILDEPMSGLDPRAQEKLRSILLNLKARGKSFIISSHSLEDILSLCERVVVLEKSRLVMNGPTAEVLDELVKRYRSSEPWDEDPMSSEAPNVEL